MADSMNEVTHRPGGRFVNQLGQYYEATLASRRRLDRVALGVEKLAVEIATVKGNLVLGRYIQDRLRQLLCTHPESSLRYGSAEAWCTVCFSPIDPADSAARDRELMAHVVTWCRCDTERCPVHHGPNSELPSTMVIAPIPESVRNSRLRPIAKLVEIDDGVL